MNNVIYTEYPRNLVYDFIYDAGGLNIIKSKTVNDKEIYYIDMCEPNLISISYERYRDKVIITTIALQMAENIMDHALKFSELLEDFLVFFDEAKVYYEKYIIKSKI